MNRNKQRCAWVFGVAMALATMGTAHGAEKEMLSASEILELVSGNTLSGVFGAENTRYAQRNHRSGITVVNIEGMPVRLIPWFVKEPASYCEDWADDGVLCYQIGRDTNSGTYFFQRADGSTSELTVAEGAQPFTFK
ncbi:hypothetical protein RHODOSMS8_02793 [Rhodobiaceae bacterium]|nr:hypothetical protein RHODOSMS8_02793 [Rhodobiaceae bacterium]